MGVARSPAEHSEGLMGLDQVDSRGRRWRRFCIAGHEYHVDMSVLEPYLQVLSHGGQRSHTHPRVGPDIHLQGADVFVKLMKLICNFCVYDFQGTMETA